MKKCLKNPDASIEKFTFLANVNSEGQLVQIAVHPKTDTATCFGKEAALFRAALPEPGLPKPFIVVIDMKITP